MMFLELSIRVHREFIIEEEQMLVRCLIVASLVSVGSIANAAITTYSTLAGFTGATTGTIGTEDFEGFTGVGGPTGGPAANGVTLDFGGVATGTVSYTGTSFVTNWASSGVVPVSGSNHLYSSNNVAPGSYTITFSGPISALGFYLTDAGDTGPTGENLPSSPTAGNPNDFTVALNGGTTTYAIPTSGNQNGMTHYFGIVDTMGFFTSVTFDHQYIADLFSIDDISVVAYVPTTGGAVPEPASASVWAGMLLLGLGFVRRKRN